MYITAYTWRTKSNGLVALPNWPEITSKCHLSNASIICALWCFLQQSLFGIHYQVSKKIDAYKNREGNWYKNTKSTLEQKQQNLVYISNSLFTHLLDSNPQHKEIVVNSVLQLLRDYLDWIQQPQQPFSTGKRHIYKILDAIANYSLFMP